MSTFPRRPLALIALLTAGLLNGCSDGEGTSEQPGVALIPANDVEYIDALVPHHEAALMMADEALERGADERVRTMAGDMKAAQMAEIEILRVTRDELEGSRETPTPDDPHMDRDMLLLAGLSDGALDIAFLEHMIPHHAGAVMMSHQALPNLERPELIDMATMTIKVQTVEMNEMLEMLAELR